ncbi:MAG: NAD-dependent epimerase/dehydratase family protein [Burkholderiaceae bacterium]
MTILVTGVAGFIGMHLTLNLIDRGFQVVGIDNLNSYYEPSLKLDRLNNLGSKPGFSFYCVDVADHAALSRVFEKHKIDQIIHLAAQAGVRYSISNPLSYGQSNLVGFLNILEMARTHTVEHLIYASSSSVYGRSSKAPFSEDVKADEPVSLYAATKRANELMAYSYSNLYGLRTTGLRFFTVYGPWGRPDMAYYSFTKAIFDGQPINVFNNGDLTRDFTYIDDIVNGIVAVLEKTADSDGTDGRDGSSGAFNVFNIGNENPVGLMHFIETLEKNIGKKAEKIFLPMQKGDVYSTHASTEKLNRWTGYAPKIGIEEGLARFVEWFRRYHQKA